MTIEIIIDGATKTVTKNELFDLAKQGKINSNTPINQRQPYYSSHSALQATTFFSRKALGSSISIFAKEKFSTNY